MVTISVLPLERWTDDEAMIRLQRWRTLDMFDTKLYREYVSTAPEWGKRVVSELCDEIDRLQSVSDGLIAALQPRRVIEER